MKQLQYVFLCVTILVFINNGTAQDSWMSLGPSTGIIEPVYDDRSIGMGQTAITTANSSSALFSNPSILGTFSDSRIHLGGKLFYGTIKSESDAYESYDASYPIFPNRSYFSFALPYKYDNRLKLVFGIAYQRNEGYKNEVEAVQLEERWGPTGWTTVKTRVTETRTSWDRGMLSAVTPGIALNVQDKFFFGATFSRTLGKYLRTLETRVSDQHNKTEMEIEQSAMYLRIGALAEVTPELSIGMTYRPGFEWELGGAIIKTYRNGELDTERDQEVIELTIPSMWGIGAKYKVSPKFIVALELQSRPYSELQWSRNFGNQRIIDDGFNVSVGAEFLELGFPVRVGAFRDVLPYADEDDIDPVDLIGLTAGIGSHSGEEFSWDASVLWGRWERTVNDDGQKYSENLFRAGVSGTYHFKAF